MIISVKCIKPVFADLHTVIDQVSFRSSLGLTLCKLKENEMERKLIFPYFPQSNSKLSFILSHLKRKSYFFLPA